MNSESHIIISFLFKRSGKDKLKESEIYLPLSIELGWFSSREARAFVAYAIKQKLLIKKDGLLTSSFDVEKIRIPVGFYPSKKSFATEKTDEKVEEEQGITDVAVQYIVEKADGDPKDIFEEIKQVVTEKNIIFDVALLFIAKKYNIDMSSYFDFVEKTIFRENEE